MRRRFQGDSSSARPGGSSGRPGTASRLLVLVGAIVFVDTMFFAALTPLLPHYAHEFGIGKTGWGLLQAAYPAGALVGAVPSGIVAARLGVKPTVIVGLVCIAVTSTAFGFADSLWQLDLARFAQGLASSFSWTGGLAWLVAAAPQGRRGALIGTAFGLAIGGALFGPVPTNEATPSPPSPCSRSARRSGRRGPRRRRRTSRSRSRRCSPRCGPATSAPGSGS